MEPDHEILRWMGALAGIAGSLIIAWGGSRTMTACGFLFTVVSGLCWVSAGLLDEETALLSEYSVLLLINLFGVWRWGRPLPDDPGLLPVLERARRLARAGAEKGRGSRS